MRWLAVVGICVSSASCIKADLIGLRRGKKPRSCMPGLAPDVAGLVPGAWKDDLAGIVADAQACEVVNFETRISPIGAGFVTFGGFAADMAQKRRDQLLGPPEPGATLGALCPATPAAAAVTVHLGGVALPAPNEPWSTPAPVPPDRRDDYLTNPPEPRYEPVWIPVARRPEAAGSGAAAAARRCAADGTPDGERTLCTFARVALQPDRRRPIVLVGHGLFDSSSHRYVRNTGAVLYAMGFSVALLDLRDHGNTLRANGPRDTGLTFGAREGHDLVAIARALRGACGAAHAGYLGFSGGAAMGVHAYAVDTGGVFDLGILAISPLVDPADTIEHFHGEQKTCFVTSALEIDWSVYATMGLFAGGMVGGSAAVYGRIEPGDVDWWRVGGMSLGATAGALFLTGVADCFFDGRSHVRRFDGCLSVSPIANLFKALLEDRWHALGKDYGLTGNPHLANYPMSRSQLSTEALKAAAKALPGRVAAAAAAKAARLAIVSANDDPVVSEDTIDPFGKKAEEAANLAVFRTAHGGHTSFAALSPVYARRFLHHFYCSGPFRCAAP